MLSKFNPQKTGRRTIPDKFSLANVVTVALNSLAAALEIKAVSFSGNPIAGRE
ncbi:hypothetical protein MH928_02130 [Flavobacterium sp. WW92]|uniref:hypothetical protein n=1 Tax=unclassified Flavobacterium TaxID=196869 RepID=UPI0022242250|nr:MULTISPECIES: hypothetical protein [unclassified Flavobacterium]WDO13509.1 hypothetical protein MH928_02130 [Flavobacterium sp. WW92]